MKNVPPIVFFDGVCGLCNGFVDRLLRTDKKGALRFAPLQGETARAVLAPRRIDLTTVYLKDGNQIFEKSEAIFRVAAIAGWRVLALGRFLPRGLTDALYDFVAKNRYLWFGKRDTCRLPTKSEAARFLP